MLIGVLLFLIPASSGFLFDLITPSFVNGAITKNHFNALLDIITEQRKSQAQMEHYIRQLEMEVEKLVNITSVIPTIQENYNKMNSELLQLHTKSKLFEMYCDNCRNSTVGITGSTNKHLAKVLEKTQSRHVD